MIFEQQIPLQLLKQTVQNYVYKYTGNNVNIVIRQDKENEDLARLEYAFKFITGQL